MTLERQGPQRLKILYVQLGTTVFAGIERVVDDIATELATTHRDDFDVDVLCTSIHRDYPAEPRRYNLIRRLSKGRRSLLSIYRKVFTEGHYDLVVIPQVEPTVLFWVATLGLRRTLVTHLHGNPRLESHHPKSKIMFALMKRIVLRDLPCIFGTSPRQLEAFAAMFGTKIPRHWLPNPVRRFAMADGVAAGTGDAVTYVNVGRFDYQKGQDILVGAFARLHRERPNTRLRLVGHGGDEPKLREQIRSLGLEAIVSIEHLPSNPQEALATSDVFVATSRWEGWSLVICEALRFGLPVVSTDCEFGPSDILVDPKLGRLTRLSDEDDLVAAMIHYHDDLAAERTFAEFRKMAIDVYSVEKVAHIHAAGLRAAVGIGA